MWWNDKTLSILICKWKPYMMYSKIFLELNPQSDNTSAETTLTEEDQWSML